MSVNLQLDQMTTEEKLEVMEALWADLSRNAKKFESPAWHKEVLDHRQRLIDEGKPEFIDWETAKKEIRERTS